ncbi:protein FAR1-RELATED SEQUENCE 5-like [Lotus japonicus]|uniref:protein FAR1-RELATED SEQUENCE 5-like n=1 Tax=Lotus japonicus TaxID=34305 RepID=UPI00258B7A2A|nr:protein FAR1-RELATED SEQUENCE 5-like [Lotus japonicus]
MRRKEFVFLECERHGMYRSYKDPKTFKYKTTGTKKLGCPFRLKGRPRKVERRWWLKVMNDIHNHEPARSLISHSYVGRLSEEEKGHVETVARSWVATRPMLVSLKENNPGNLTTITQVYSCCKRFRKFVRGPLTEMQHLMKKLVEDKYVHFERQQDDSYVIRDVFWTHPVAVKLFNTFPHLVIMDCTYKIKKYQIPLLEIVDITSNDMTFSIALCYMIHECTNDYIWVLECMKSLIADPARLPKVIVTDKDLALLSVVHKIFPSSSHLLCRFHINKTVEAKFKLHVGTNDFDDLVMDK